MSFCEVHFAVRWFSLAALVTLGLPAASQQAIQYSKPVDTDSSKSDAVAPDVTRRDPASFNAPTPVFAPKSGASFDLLPGSTPPVFYNANPQQWQKFLDGKKNWTLMTPEEILGIPTAEKILGVASPDDDPNLSPDERFLRRRDRQVAMAATNGVSRTDSFSWQKEDSQSGFLQTPGHESPFAKLMTSPAPDANRNLSSLFIQHSDGPGNVDGKANSTWASPFNTPDLPAPPTPEQIANMERFHALMDPLPSAKAPQTAGFFAAPVVAPDPNMTPVPASFNPNGRSFRGLESDITRPTGLTPLPGITGPIPQPKKIAPLVQPPPWMQSGMQSSTLPQRQF